MTPMRRSSTFDATFAKGRSCLAINSAAYCRLHCSGVSYYARPKANIVRWRAHSVSSDDGANAALQIYGPAAPVGD